MRTALVLGCSDGIGLQLVRDLLERGWSVSGLSRSPSPVEHEQYRHEVTDFADPSWPAPLEAWTDAGGAPDLCVYCAGIGQELDPTDLGTETRAFEVNLAGLVKTLEVLVPAMVARGSGHVIGLSSLADAMPNWGAPAYAASKAGMSRYLEGLALALRAQGVAVTNIRFGFVDTKMAKSEVKPMMMSVGRASAHVLHAIERRPVRMSRPLAMAWLLAVLAWLTEWRIRWLSRW